jgi:hypothetical protein
MCGESRQEFMVFALHVNSSRRFNHHARVIAAAGKSLREQAGKLVGLIELFGHTHADQLPSSALETLRVFKPSY